MSEARPRVWVSQPLYGDIEARLDDWFDVSRTARVTDHAPGAIAAALADVDGALVTLNDRIGAAEVAGAPRLRAVANVGVGYNNLDIAALDARGIVATNTPDVLTETTADFGFALMMATARRITEAEHWLRAGNWQGWGFHELLGTGIHGSTLGILGMGRIGQGIARRARGFDMRVLYHNRNRLPDSVERDCAAAYVDRDTLLATSDHLVLVLPYSAANHHIIDAAALARMRPGATLTNIARGGLVDEDALADALAGGRLAAAGLDVFEGEPVVNPRLLGCRNVVLTPHIASATLATRRAMVSLAVDNLVAALGRGPHAGRPPTPIRPRPDAGRR
ncbi:MULTISPECIES: D-glycerate dehydrogenase [unclassified Luteimonas]|uniref:2-hydroxyacid dehydrogenase n=1 Tax=unclassified Luteimonas TaxID=2629088 RepID=UPI001601D1E5|nr:MULTISPECIES: D-glycerate dehydrogenase [unclassified Luteimonas]MBB1471772.1 D-glycerate dehydrogenase [Luteimonas sp. MC1782]MBB6599485.1 D-glycerate dehydrogenase [Luteimonas sp. MC1825]QOC87184.1 D-glycerate dehydrogenase [Luteimonas sp. MC1825]